MYRTIVFAGLALALTTLPAAAQMITISPAQIGQIFCISRLGNDMAPVQGLLTPSLTQAIADAEKMDADWAAKNPGDKPPLGDGIPWQAFPDYAPQCAAGNVDLGKDGALVEINYTFPDSPTPVSPTSCTSPPSRKRRSTQPSGASTISSTPMPGAT